MNISPIGYQSMAVSKNSRQQNTTSNFKANGLAPIEKQMPKLPEYLAKMRVKAQSEISANRAEKAKLEEALKSDSKNEELIKQIRSLEIKTLSIIRDFNEQLSEYMNSTYKYKGKNSGFNILTELSKYYLG